VGEVPVARGRLATDQTRAAMMFAAAGANGKRAASCLLTRATCGVG